MRNKIEILHVAQSHGDPVKSFDEHIESDGLKVAIKLLDKIVQAQLKVVQTIKKYSNIPVVNEGCDRTLSHPLTDDIAIQLSDVIKEIFPQGIPEKLDSLTYVQKRLLYDYGAPFLLFMLGQITTLYRSCDEDGELAEAEKHLSSIKNDNYYNKLLDILDVPREKEAIQYAIEAIYLDNNKINTTCLPNRQVLLVYGSAHNFKRHCIEPYLSQYGLLDIAVQVIDCSSSNKMQKPPSTSHCANKSDEIQLACVKKLTTLLDDYKAHLEKRPQTTDFIYQQKIIGINKLLSILAEEKLGAKERVEKFKAELIYKENNTPSIFEILNTRRFNIGFQDGSIALLKGIIVALAYVTILPASLAWLITHKPTYAHFFTVTGQDLNKTFQSMDVCPAIQTP